FSRIRFTVLTKFVAITAVTPLILTEYKCLVEVEIMTGTKLTPLDTLHPFTFCRRQYPVRLCYVTTIDKTALYLPRTGFTHGQLYIALSRVTSPEGLKTLDDTS
ncbi:hypothetical protein HID58_006778, partial [Brassica napus]